MAFLALIMLFFLALASGQVDRFNLPFNDSSGGLQWYINTDHENHYNVKDVWKMNYTGAGVVVAVVDEGLDPTHPELKKNYDRSASYDFVDDRKPKLLTGHGSNCAGVIAAEGNNGQCGVGLAYNARIGDIRLFVNEMAPDEKEAAAFKFKREYIDIYSNSWGPSDKGFEVEGPGNKTLKALKEGAEEGRNGAGSIFVFAAGNGGIIARDSCAFNGYVNSIYTIAITGIKRDGTVPSYGERCPGIMAVTYSRDMFGDRNPVVTAGQRGQCEFYFGGSSAAAAMASGLIALTLEANPRLTWRDLQHIIARSARFPGRKPPDLVTNGAGLKVSNYMGFGLMDALKMVTYAKGWTKVPEQQRCEIFKIFSSPKRRSYTTTGKQTVDLSSWPTTCGRPINFLEHVQVRVNLRVWPRGDLLLNLQSPNGTVSRLTQYRPIDRFRGYSTNLTDWVILSLHHWGENPRGTWKLTWNKGQLFNWTLILSGTSVDPLIDNNHVRDAVVPKQQPGRTESPDSQKTGYIIQITTNKHYNWAHAKARIKLFGVDGQTDEHELTSSGKTSSSERSHLFYIRARAVGKLNTIQLRVDRRAGIRTWWKLNSVAVRPDGNKSWIVLPYNHWIRKGQAEIYIGACPKGFQRNSAGKCIDINECLKRNAHCQGRCVNYQGGFRCSCFSGYRWNEFTKRCTDINECLTRNEHCQGRCYNYQGGFRCSCFPGYRWNWYTKRCTDIDECAVSKGGCEQICTNLPGSYECSCNSGYHKSEDSKRCEANVAPAPRPKTCKDLQQQRLGQAYMLDGEYRIYPLKDCNTSISVYCRGMSTTDPKEYLTLVDGNFVLNWRGTTIFNKVRFDPVKMLIIRNDKHFADSGSHNYGSATTCCPSMGAKCKHTWFRINLSGTGLRLNKQVRWEATGGTRIDWEQKIDGRINFISCKGSCGECSPSDNLSLSIIGC